MSKGREHPHTILVSDHFSETGSEGTFEVAFRRWLVRELDAGRMTVGSAIEQFKFNPVNGDGLIRSWRRKYGSQVALTLPVMTEKERHKMEALQKQLKALEQQLEQAQLKNAALETLIDVAEEKLKIPIRKKSGPKQ